MRHRKSREENARWGFIAICRRSWKRLRMPRAARRFSTPWPTARRLPGSSSTCSASMISRQRSCGTASGSGSQNRGAKKEAFWTYSKLTNLNVQKGLGELAVSHLVPLLEFNLCGSMARPLLCWTAPTGCQP